jgi:hypothetical protein
MRPHALLLPIASQLRITVLYRNLHAYVLLTTRDPLCFRDINWILKKKVSLDTPPPPQLRHAFPPSTSDDLYYCVQASPTTQQGGHIRHPPGRNSNKDFGVLRFQRRACLSIGACLFVVH